MKKRSMIEWRKTDLNNLPDEAIASGSCLLYEGFIPSRIPNHNIRIAIIRLEGKDWGWKPYLIRFELDSYEEHCITLGIAQAQAELRLQGFLDDYGLEIKK